MNKIEALNLPKSLFDYLKEASLSKIAIILISLFSLKKIFSYLNNKRIKNNKHSNLIRQGKTHRTKRDKEIEEFTNKYKNSISKERIKEIISLDATSLLNHIHEQIITSYESVLAYCLRTAEHGKVNNWITEVLFEEALDQAKVSDEIIKKNKLEGKPILPLQGLPLSIKDNFIIKGKFSTIGICKFLSDKNEDGSLTNLAKEDGYFVKLMREKGAVIYVKTNTPQNMMATESTNNLWGATLNPWNNKKTCGGSSGGEGGIIGGFCSPMGIGTDIGGSIRIPSVYCGIYGFKPTATRLCRIGQIGLNGKKFSPNNFILPTLGPMARSSRDLVFMMRNLFGSFTDDFYCNSHPFDEEVYNKAFDLKSCCNKPTIAFINEMKYCEFAPELKTALKDIKEKLIAKGYQCEDLNYDFYPLLQTGKNILVNCGIAEEVEKTLGDEKCMPYYEKYFLIRRLPNFLIKFLRLLMKFQGNTRNADTLGICLHLNKTEFLEEVQKLQELKFKFVKELSSKNIQAVVCPVMPLYAPNIGTGEKAVGFSDLSVLFNILDMPSGVVPISISEGLDYTPICNDDCSDFLKENISEKGMPVCIQVAALPGKDEASLKLIQQIDEFYRFDKNHMMKIIQNLN